MTRSNSLACTFERRSSNSGKSYFLRIPRDASLARTKRTESVVAFRNALIESRCSLRKYGGKPSSPLGNWSNQSGGEEITFSSSLFMPILSIHLPLTPSENSGFALVIHCI